VRLVLVTFVLLASRVAAAQPEVRQDGTTRDAVEEGDTDGRAAADVVEEAGDVRASSSEDGGRRAGASREPAEGDAQVHSDGDAELVPPDAQGERDAQNVPESVSTLDAPSSRGEVPRAPEEYERAAPEDEPLGLPPDAEVPPRPGRRERPRPRGEGDPGRGIALPTAWTLDEDDDSFNNYGLGSFGIEVSLSDELQLGVQSAIPVGFVGLGLSVKWGRPFRFGAFGVQVQTFAGWLFFEDTDWAALAGGGPILTLGTRDHFVSIGAFGYGVVAGRTFGTKAFGVVMPTLAASVRVAERARLVAEVWVPGRTDDGRQLGELVVLLYGVRAFGPRFWADVGLFRHFCRPGCLGIYETLPAGVPYVSFGRLF